MSYRATFDASHKVTTKGGHHVKFMRHIARDVDRANGVVHPVANDNVDWSRTQHNRTMVYDGNGGFRPAKSSDELIAATDDLLVQVKNQRMPNGSWRSGIRSNSVVLRPLVLSLPNEWYDEHSPGWRDGDYSPAAEKLHADIEEFVLSRFPARNVPGYLWHCDESLAAQLQLPFVPLTDDGRLSQGDFFTGPKHLSELHKDFRAFLRDRGYDVEMKSSERSREHLNSDEFQQRADKLREGQGKLDASLADLEEAENDLEARTQDVVERETDWLTRKRRLDAREADLDWRDQETADDRLAAQNERREAAEAQRIANANQRVTERAKAQAEADRQYARDLVAKIEYMDPLVDDWLDRRKVGDGRTMRDLFNEDTKKRRAVLAEVRALTATDAPQQTGPRTGDHGLGG